MLKKQCTSCGQFLTKLTTQMYGEYCSASCQKRETTKKAITAAKPFRERRRNPELNVVREEKCECCGITEWNSQPVAFKWFHINGNTDDFTPPNLLKLCPNCFSQK